MRHGKRTFGGLTVTAPPPWKDVTHEMGAPAPPFTLADTSVDVGVLQFSVARYVGGQIPDPSAADLLAMAEELGAAHRLGEPFGHRVQGGKMRRATVSYHDGDDFIRVWYVSDGRDIAKVTYVAPWERRDQQTADCDAIVASIGFNGTNLGATRAGRP
jgi:hypothetical protein